MSTHDEHAALEALVARTLRDQPALQAPATLEARVAEAIARRAAQPWWQRGFPRWPLAARAAFVLVSLAAVARTVAATAWLLAGLRSASVDVAAAERASQLAAAGRAVASMTAAAAYIFDSIPTFWLYSGAVAGVALYAMFFGLGAAAYRTLYK